jgi:hypothetical protein
MKRVVVLLASTDRREPFRVSPQPERQRLVSLLCVQSLKHSELVLILESKAFVIVLINIPHRFRLHHLMILINKDPMNVCEARHD